MKYSVRIMEHGLSHYEKGKRYNNVPKRFIKFLLKNKFCFNFGINTKKMTVYSEYASHYIEVYLKPTHLISCTEEESIINSNLNKKLEKILEKY